MNTKLTEEDLKDTLRLLKMGVINEDQAIKELFNLFNINQSVAIDEYVEHCIMCRENNLPMLEWDSYQKQFCD